MYQTIPAVFENGIFRPLKKVRLKQHQRLLLKLEISKDNYDSLVETLEVLSDNDQVGRIQSALKEAAKGNIFSHQDVFGYPQPNL